MADPNQINPENLITPFCDVPNYFFPPENRFIGDIEDGIAYPYACYTKEESDERYAPKSAETDISVLVADMQQAKADILTKADKKDIVYITPQMYGATGDGIIDDTDALQTFIDNVCSHSIYGIIPNGEYKITKPLVIRAKSYPGVNSDISSSIVRISGAGSSVIRKYGHITDEYGNDSIITIAGVEPSNGCSNVIIHNIELIGCGTGHYLATDPTKYGIFIKNTLFGAEFDYIKIKGTAEGITGRLYMTTLSRIECFTRDYGFKMNAGTSLSFIACYCQLQQISAFFLYLCVYTTLTSCGADGVNGTAYDFRFSIVTLNNCGSENLYGEHILNSYQSNIMINGGYYLANPNFETVAFTIALKSKVVVQSARISTLYNIVSSDEDIAMGKLFTVESQAYIKFIDCQLCKFTQASNWSAVQSHLKNQATIYNGYWDNAQNKMIMPMGNSKYRDYIGLPIFETKYVDNGIATPYYLFGDEENFEITTENDEFVITGTNPTGETTEIYLVFADKISNFTKFSARLSFESTYSGIDGDDGGLSIFMASGERMRNLPLSNALVIYNTPFAEGSKIGNLNSKSLNVYGDNLIVLRLKIIPFAGENEITHTIKIKSLILE